MKYVLAMTKLKSDSNLIPDLDDLTFCKVFAARVNDVLNPYMGTYAAPRSI
jgi:hypothetical protein